MDYIKYIRQYIGSRKMILNCSGVLIIKDGRILFQRRSDNGRWGLVGGMLELGETYAEAAVREAREETGLEVRLTAFLGVFHNYDMVWSSGDRAHTVGAYFEAEPVGGELRTDSESLELRFFAPDEVPELVFEDNIAAVRSYLAGIRYPIPEENRRSKGNE